MTHFTEEKKNKLIGHRRAKTDLGVQFQQSKLQLPLKLNQSWTNRRTRTQNKQQASIRQTLHNRFQSQLPIYRNKSNNFTYNKWYIKPEVRMKKSLLATKTQKTDTQFAYNRLYEESTLREDCPFLTTKNSKLKLLQKIPVHNLRLLEVFKKNQQLKKKRVPKIIQLFLKKKSNATIQ